MGKVYSGEWRVTSGEKRIRKTQKRRVTPRSSVQTSRERDNAEKQRALRLAGRRKGPGGVSEVWQAKGLWEGVCGSVANEGVTG